MEFKHLNAAPVQTWNWLAINDTDLRLPDSLVALLPSSFRKATEDKKETPRLGDIIEALAQKKNTFMADKASQKAYTVLLDSDNPAQQTSITVKKDCHARLSIAALGRETDTQATAHALTILLEEGSSLTVEHLVAQSDQQMHIESISAALGKNARLLPIQFFLGSGQILSGTDVQLNKEGAEFVGSAQYAVSSDQVLDLTYTLKQKGPRTASNLQVSGVLSDNASKTLRATIDLQKGCKGAQGTENETVVLAGDSVINKTLPTILCAEDDVEGNHGATIGSLSDEMLFYLATRGITEDDAATLMKEAILDNAATSLNAPLSDAALSWAQWAQGPEAFETASSARAFAEEV